MGEGKREIERVRKLRGEKKSAGEDIGSVSQLEALMKLQLMPRTDLLSATLSYCKYSRATPPSEVGTCSLRPERVRDSGTGNCRERKSKARPTLSGNYLVSIKGGRKKKRVGREKRWRETLIPATVGSYVPLPPSRNLPYAREQTKRGGGEPKQSVCRTQKGFKGCFSLQSLDYST